MTVEKLNERGEPGDVDDIRKVNAASDEELAKMCQPGHALMRLACMEKMRRREKRRMERSRPMKKEDTTPMAEIIDEAMMMKRAACPPGHKMVFGRCEKVDPRRMSGKDKQRARILAKKKERSAEEIRRRQAAPAAKKKTLAAIEKRRAAKKTQPQQHRVPSIVAQFHKWGEEEESVKTTMAVIIERIMEDAQIIPFPGKWKGKGVSPEEMQIAKGLQSEMEALRIGDTYERNGMRFHLFRGSTEVTDLTNAGKRGKFVERFSVRFAMKAEEKQLYATAALMRAHDYQDAVGFARKLAGENVGVYVDDSKVKGIEVDPAGVEKIDKKGDYVNVLVRDPKFAIISDLEDQNNQPYISTDKARESAKFVSWIRANLDKILKMKFSEVRRAAGDAGISVHTRYFMDDKEPEGEVVAEEEEEKRHMEVANTILQQMGGTRLLSMMVGAKNFVGFPKHNEKEPWPGVSFKIGKGAKKSINMVSVILHPSDTYIVEFGRSRGGTMKVVERMEDIYADSLKDVFERVTGFTLTVPKIIFR